MLDYVYSLEVLEAPAVEPLSLDEVKLHLRVDTPDEDDLISALIVAAREWTETYCRRSWIQRTLKLRLDYFPPEILLPRGPVVAVESISFIGSNGTTAEVDPLIYVVDPYSLPGRIRPALGSAWPVVMAALNAVEVTYDAGYPAPAPLDAPEPNAIPEALNVPQSAKAAMKLLIGGWYENREHVAEKAPVEVPLAVKALLASLEVRDYRLE